MKPSHLLKKIFGFFTFLFVTIVAVIFSISLWVYLYPKDAWQFAQNHLLPEDLKIEWSESRIAIDHIEGFNWDVNLFFKNLKVKKQSPHVSVTIDRIQLTANATLFSPETKIHIKNLQIRSDSPVLISTEASNEPLNFSPLLEKLTSGINKVQKALQQVVIDQIDIQLHDLQYSPSGAKPVMASIKILKSAADARQINFEITVRDLPSVLSYLHVGGIIEIANFNSSTPFFNATIELKGEKIKAKMPFALVYDENQLKSQSKLNGSYKLKSGWLQSDSVINITAGKNELNVSLSGNISGIPGPLPEVKNIKAAYNLPLNETDWMSSKGSAIISAPIPLFFVKNKTRKLIEQRCNCRLPHFVGVEISTDIWLDRLLDPPTNKNPAVKAELRVDSLSNAIIFADLRAELEILKNEKSWTFLPALNSRIHIKRFQDILAILRANRILIPAPFSVLEGDIDFTAKSPVGIHKTTGEITAQTQLSTNLKSPRQKVALNTVAYVTAASGFKTIAIDFDALIQSLQLELPPLEPISGLPRLVRDSRIRLKPVVAKKKRAIKLLLSFKIRTAEDAAIQLLHPLAHPHVPITVNYKRSGGDNEGSAVIESFKIKYLKRELFVDSLKLSLYETADMDFPIDGQFHVNQTNYKVIIRVAGTLKNPHIELSSDPYLNRADIVSVLLFDRTRENLVGADAETSGSAQAAIADRAVGLLGLWAFASTSIRSVSYNSLTKEYSATVDLGEGLTAGIGTSLDEYTSFEIRKRLSKRWVITTSWAPSESDENFGEVVLQWEKRY